MKKITITHSNGTQTIRIVENEIDFNSGGIYYVLSNESETFFKLAKTDKVTIEDYEPRDWCLVVGIASKSIYALKESQFSIKRQVKIQDFLTETEAGELVKSINKKMDSYKF